MSSGQGIRKLDPIDRLDEDNFLNPRPDDRRASMTWLVHVKNMGGFAHFHTISHSCTYIHFPGS